MMAGTQKDEFWVKAQRIRIKEAFALFDKDKKGTVGAEDISTLMRYLGAYPTEEAMTKDVLPDMQGGDSSAPVPYPVFETKMLDIMASKAWDPDPPEVLLQAFRTIDEAGVGYIETTRMNELLMTKGTPFRAKEIEAFNSVAKDPETGHIYFEDYVTFLAMQT